MDTLLQIKEYTRRFYSKFEVYIVPLLKFLVSFIGFLMINQSLGYMDKINSVAIVLVAALLCSFLPSTFIVLIGGLLITAHTFALSMECAAVILVLFLVLFLLYFRFSPKDSMVVVLMAICFGMRIPIVVPICAGLIATPSAAVAVACGSIGHSIVSLIADHAEEIGNLGGDGALERFRYIADALLDNKGMLVSAISFAVTLVIVYVVRRLPVKFAWFYAMGAGVVLNMLIQLIGGSKFETGESFIGILLSSILAIAIAIVVQFFVFNVNFDQTEHVQFEDDDYYYFVKAVPKNKGKIATKTASHVETRTVSQQARPAERTQVKQRATTEHMGVGTRGVETERRAAMPQTRRETPTSSAPRSMAPSADRTPMSSRSTQQTQAAPAASAISTLQARAAQQARTAQQTRTTQQRGSSQGEVLRTDRPITARTPSTAAREEAKRAAQAAAMRQQAARTAKDANVSNQFTSSIEGLENFDLKDN